MLRVKERFLHAVPKPYVASLKSIPLEGDRSERFPHKVGFQHRRPGGPRLSVGTSGVRQLLWRCIVVEPSTKKILSGAECEMQVSSHSSFYSWVLALQVIMKT
jgi:hypothetical protein